MEKLTRQLAISKDKFNNEVIETQAKFMELDRMASDLKESHNERKNLVKQWEDIIVEMKKRKLIN